MQRTQYRLHRDPSIREKLRKEQSRWDIVFNNLNDKVDCPYSK